MKTFCVLRRSARNFNCTVPQPCPPPNPFSNTLSLRDRVNYAKIFCQLHVAREFVVVKRTLAGFVARLVKSELPLAAGFVLDPAASHLSSSHPYVYAMPAT